MRFAVDQHSKSDIKRAARAISKGEARLDDEFIIRDWRDSHAHVLNTFQINLRDWINKIGIEAVLVQRLKRLTTIKNKLQTSRASHPLNDIAGCRLIFNSIKDLSEFRAAFMGKCRAKHKLISQGKYDYIESPKSTGYRGIHDVYAYAPTKDSTQQYSGLRVEIQYRTKKQHAWATAVETADAIDRTELKFSKNDQDKRLMLFKLASEYIARQENRFGCFREMSQEELESQIKVFEEETGVINRLRLLGKQGVAASGKHLVLTFREDLEVKNFRRSSQAMAYRNEMEVSSPEADTVYVYLDNPKELESAFRNYFRDAKEFVDLMPI